MPSTLAQSMLCALAAATVDNTAPQAARIRNIPIMTVLRGWARWPGCSTSLRSRWMPLCGEWPSTGRDGRLKNDRGPKSSLCEVLSLAVNSACFTLVRQSACASIPLEFRKGEAERYPCTKFLDRTSIHQGVAESNVKTQVVLDLPDRANQAGKGSC